MSLARLGLVPILGLAPVLGFGCSDPPPATARGAFSVHFVSSSNCPVNGHTTTVGDVDGQNKTTVLTDGDSDASIKCTVSGSGSFTVSASAFQGLSSLTIALNSISTGATESKPATGSVSFSSSETGGSSANSDTSCRFYFLPDSDEGVDAGMIWVTFECDKMILQGQEGCSISKSYAVFENCET